MGVKPPAAWGTRHSCSFPPGGPAVSRETLSFKPHTRPPLLGGATLGCVESERMLTSKTSNFHKDTFGMSEWQGSPRR